LDIFVLTSYRRESFGIAVAEAMSMGIPAIVTDIPGLREVVQDEVTGLIVPPKDSDKLAKAILRLITDQKLRDKMGIASRKRIQDHFSQERMIASFIKLFESVTVTKEGLYENRH
jgi:L-malate glycosyltransferase